MKLEGRLFTGNRMTDIKEVSLVSDPDAPFSRNLENALILLCHELDIPTPVLTKTHIFNFAKFNHVKFPARDFVESLGYDHLYIENIL